ncbi:Hypothetical predicted protein [Paramuricea clavata]|uniref:Uncharacterized protein n=1 Tax=Paramuricea clavata TaxID=317549 RepID=A0A6S7JV70_PARCT|nr:Hypothetical predicted protein [Paramuricea clavata]
MKREHDISSSSSIPPSSPSPIMSTANFADSRHPNDSCASELSSSVSSSSSSRAKSARRSRRTKLSPISQSPNHSPIISSTIIPSTNPPSFPSPPISQIPSTTEPVLESLVALNGCTDVQSDSPTSHSPDTPKPLDPMVALIGCTDEDRSPTITHSPPDTEVVINPLVAFIGCTDDVTASHNHGPLPTPSPPSENVPNPVIRDLSPDDDDDDPFDIPPPLSPPRPSSQFSFLSRPPSPPSSHTSPYSLNPSAPVFQSTQNISLSPPLGAIPSSPINGSTSSNVDDSIPTNSSPDAPTEYSSKFIEKWSSSFTANSSWQEFSEQCDQFANDVVSECESNFQSKKNAVPCRPGRPSARPISNNRRPLQYNPIGARRIQSLYRISKKRAARQVISDNKPSYSGSVDEANEFFSRVFREKTVDADAVKKGLDEFVPSGPKDNTLGDPITSAKVSKKLCFLSNSAPGADRVEYRHLKSVDPKGVILCNTYNRCLLENDVPVQWKSSRTVLIHKKGDVSDVSNFRPIALMSCIYKLFMSVMAERLVNYSIENNLLSSSQKSARPTEGCYEHTFILQSLVLDAKRHQKNLLLAWLDLRNAFGSVPHDVISVTLSHLGVPDSVVNLVKNVYTNATTEVRTPAGITPGIPINAGVK